MNTREDRYIHVHIDRNENTGACGECIVYEGVERFRARFVRLATDAGIALGAPQGSKPLSFWLDSLFLDLLESKSKHLRFATNKCESGIVEYACKASAVFCERLETNALEGEHSSRSAINSATTLHRTTEGVISGNAVGRKPRLAASFVEVAGNMWADAVRQSASGNVSLEQLQTIAAELDSRGFYPPAKYLENRCAYELKSYNSRNSRSKAGPIDQWHKLVIVADKDHARYAAVTSHGALQPPPAEPTDSCPEMIPDKKSRHPHAARRAYLSGPRSRPAIHFGTTRPFPFTETCLIVCLATNVGPTQKGAQLKQSQMITVSEPFPLLDPGEYVAVCTEATAAWARQWKKHIARLVLEPANYQGRPYRGQLCAFLGLGKNPEHVPMQDRKATSVACSWK